MSSLNRGCGKLASLKLNETGIRHVEHRDFETNSERRWPWWPRPRPSQSNNALKTALILAAEESKHSKDKSLKSYCTFLADERPELFAGLLGKLIPVQARVKTDARIDFEKLKLNMDMPLETMIANFEAKI